METSSDLVNYFRLEYRAFPDYIEHTRVYSDEARGIRKAKETTQWSRTEEISQGGFGDVWLEKERGGQLRAVKEIRKYDEMSRKIDYERELLAMAYFSRVIDLPYTVMVCPNVGVGQLDVRFLSRMV